MQYPNVVMVQFVIAFLCCFLPTTYSIIGRDLVLTPKQGLQLNGKSIYYEEDPNEALRNLTTVARPWERTLKHVTFVTLFTNVAADAAAGNVSKLKEYTDFLHSPYMNQQAENDARFGDIATLATGRVEEGENGTFRFVEGNCDYKCVPERVWALWQVQRIRHRADNRKFRYEMKFSVSPLRYKTNEAQEKANEAVAAVNRRKADEGNFRRTQEAHHYIQKDDDYPQSFGRIIYRDENNFAARQKDAMAIENNEASKGRNFRQVASGSESNSFRYRQAAEGTTLTGGLEEIGEVGQVGSEFNGEGPWIPSKSFGIGQVEEAVRGGEEIGVRRYSDEGINRKGNIFTEERPLPFGNNYHFAQAEGAVRGGRGGVGGNFISADSAPTPLAQPTFVHGMFQPHPNFGNLPRPPALPPVLPPAPQKLNIGEFVKGYPGKPASKIELFPNILNMVTHRNAYYPTPTTYRPQYQMKFPRPETSAYQTATVGAELPSQSVPLPRQHYAHNQPYQQHQQEQHQQQEEELVKFPDNSPEQLMGNEAGKLGPAVVTHHFHHHFYMPPPPPSPTTQSEENELNSREQPNALTEVTPAYFGSYYNGKITTQTQQNSPAPQKINVGFPQAMSHKSESINDEGGEVDVSGDDEDYIVQVSPVPTLKRPHYHQSYTASSAIKIVEPQVPLLIQRGAGHQREQKQTKARSKQQPFIQSEPLENDGIRYSEPDPLYHNSNNQVTQELVTNNTYNITQGTQPSFTQYQRQPYGGLLVNARQQNLQEQEEIPQNVQAEQRHKQQPQVIENVDEHREDEQETAQDAYNQEERPRSHHHDQEHHFSFKNLKISANRKFKAGKRTTPRADEQFGATLPPATTTTTTTTTTTPASTTSTITSTATTTPTPAVLIITPEPQEEPQDAPTADTVELTTSLTLTAPSNDNTADLATTTISSESTLARAHTRHRNPYNNRINSSTTPAPVLKWKPRRKGGAYSNGKSGLHRRQGDTKAKGSIKHLQKVAPSSTTTTTTSSSSPVKFASATLATTTSSAGTATTMPPPSLLQPNSKEIIEVLTQKSVSKSVSIKVGENGEEIPILIDDDDENENKYEEKGNGL